MNLKIPAPMLSAIAASALTAAAIGAFDAPAATTTKPPGQAPTLKNIYTRETLMDAQLDRIEAKAKLLDGIQARMGEVYRRLGSSYVHSRTPIQLLYETWCVVKEIPDSECGNYTPAGKGKR